MLGVGLVLPLPAHLQVLCPESRQASTAPKDLVVGPRSLAVHGAIYFESACHRDSTQWEYNPKAFHLTLAQELGNFGLPLHSSSLVQTTHAS